MGQAIDPEARVPGQSLRRELSTALNQESATSAWIARPCEALSCREPARACICWPPSRLKKEKCWPGCTSRQWALTAYSTLQENLSR